MSDRSLKVAAFDLDDTLYPEYDYMLTGFENVSKLAYRTLGVTGFSEALLRVYGERGADGHTFNVALDRLGIPQDEVLIQSMVSAYHDSSQSLVLSLFPDVLPALERLHMTHRLVLITDGLPEIQCNKISALDLEHMFDNIYCTGRYGRQYWKPAPLVFEQVMADFGVGGPSCAYVGNDPTKDFLAPNKLGWLTVQVCRGNEIAHGEPRGPNYIAQVQISTLDQLDAVLESSEAR